MIRTAVDTGSIRRSKVSVSIVFKWSFIVVHAFVGVVFYIFYSFLDTLDSPVPIHRGGASVLIGEVRRCVVHGGFVPECRGDVARCLGVCYWLVVLVEDECLYLPVAGRDAVARVGYDGDWHSGEVCWLSEVVYCLVDFKEVVLDLRECEVEVSCEVVPDLD